MNNVLLDVLARHRGAFLDGETPVPKLSAELCLGWHVAPSAKILNLNAHWANVARLKE